MTALGDVATFVRGINFKPDDVVSVGTPGTVACLRTKNVQEDLDLSDVWGVPNEFVRRDEQHLQEGDLLISSANSWNLVGKCSWVPELPWRASFGGFVTVLRASTDRIDARFLYRWFSSEPIQATLRSFGQKTTNISNLNLDRCRSLRVPLPPLPEQRRIAAILDQADTLQTQRRAALAQLDSLSQSLFLDMFGNAEAEGWPMTTIADIVDEQNGSIRTGPFGSQLLHSEFVNEGVAVLGIDNAVSNEFRWGDRRFITQEKYRELKRYTVRPGDVLITIMGTCGRCAVVPNDVPVAINTKHLCCITVDSKKCTPLFLHAYFLRHPMARKYLEQTAKGAIMAGLNMGIIKAMPIPLPPLPLQQTFATRIQAIEALKAQHRAALAELDALFASLQHRAFSGELTAQPPHQPTPRSFTELGQLNANKGVEALVYAARRLPGKGHYWPLKAQYVADRRHLERHGRTLYGETYVAMPYGPVPQAAFNASRALAEGELICELPMDAVRAALRRDGDRLVALRDADPHVLGADERESLDWAIRIVADLSFDELKNQTHDSAWEKTPRNAPMAWQDIVATLDPAAQQRLLKAFKPGDVASH